MFEISGDFTAKKTPPKLGFCFLKGEYRGLSGMPVEIPHMSFQTEIKIRPSKSSSSRFVW
jgi:hypothetical protein